MAARPLSLKARALQWLAQREHSRVELRRKLLRVARQRAAEAAETGEEDPSAGAEIEVEAVLDWLAAHHYLSEARFVESRVNARAPRYGNLRIRQELGQHGAALDPAAAEQLKESELARARAVWARKYGGDPAGTAVERARQTRFLAGRGFSSEVIRRIVRTGAAEPDGPL
ncbi:MAG TPA: recombination regulator RecX [Burkholderiaceae bacterium]